MMGASMVLCDLAGGVGRANFRALSPGMGKCSACVYESHGFSLSHLIEEKGHSSAQNKNLDPAVRQPHGVLPGT